MLVSVNLEMPGAKSRWQRVMSKTKKGKKGHKKQEEEDVRMLIE